jgi:NAD(P)-dependent dehydrogenase (short-subunit alcohol dehydrogenase family)
MQGKTVLITGGNAGVGKETAVGLASMGADVVITSRDPGKGERAAREIRERTGKAVTVLSLDLASFASIRGLAAEVLERYERLDVLINNAGLILGRRRETQEGFEMTLGVNHLGHFLLTSLLQERIVASTPARIINVASEAHRRAFRGLDFDDLQARGRYNGLAVYDRSKLANIYYTRELARRLEGTGVTVNAVHPGLVRTEFALEGDTLFIGLFYRLFGPFMGTAEKGARTSIWAASSPDLEGASGRYYGDCREVTPTRLAQDDRIAARLWEVSEQLVASVDA